jgi:hypothetical protein
VTESKLFEVNEATADPTAAASLTDRLAADPSELFSLSVKHFNPIVILQLL